MARKILSSAAACVLLLAFCTTLPAEDSVKGDRQPAGTTPLASLEAAQPQAPAPQAVDPPEPPEDAIWPPLPEAAKPPARAATPAVVPAASRPTKEKRRLVLRRSNPLNAHAATSEKADILTRLHEQKVRAWPCLDGGICNWQAPVEEAPQD